MRSLGETSHLDGCGSYTGRVPGLRVTPNVYTTLEEIDTFSDVMEGIIKKGTLPV